MPAYFSNDELQNSKNLADTKLRIEGGENNLDNLIMDVPEGSFNVEEENIKSVEIEKPIENVKTKKISPPPPPPPLTRNQDTRLRRQRRQPSKSEKNIDKEEIEEEDEEGSGIGLSILLIIFVIILILFFIFRK